MDPFSTRITHMLRMQEKPRTYVLQHAHCGHIAVASRRRSQLETIRINAHVNGRRDKNGVHYTMHAWRVRLEPADPPKGSCEKCVDDMKILAPSKAGRRARAKAAKAARS